MPGRKRIMISLKARGLGKLRIPSGTNVKISVAGGKRGKALKSARKAVLSRPRPENVRIKKTVKRKKQGGKKMPIFGRRPLGLPKRRKRRLPGQKMDFLAEGSDYRIAREKDNFTITSVPTEPRVLTSAQRRRMLQGRARARQRGA